MNSRTELVMGRYRTLKAEGLTGLEASRVVLKEAQEWTLGRDETPVTKPNNVTPVTKLPATRKQVTPGRPKRYTDAAERQRAYRERSRG